MRSSDARGKRNLNDLSEPDAAICRAYPADMISAVLPKSRGTVCFNALCIGSINGIVGVRSKGASTANCPEPAYLSLFTTPKMIFAMTSSFRVGHQIEVLGVDSILSTKLFG